MNNIGHWITKLDEFEPIEWVGFIYSITNKIDGTKYIGKKQFFSHRTKLEKGKKNRTHTISESDWKSYTSSSKLVIDLILKLGKDNFIFEILELHTNKGELSYAEMELQFKLDVIKARDENGNRLYYNNNIGNVKFGNVGWTEESRAKLSAKLKGRKIGPMKEETKRKQSIAHVGKKLTDQQRLNMCGRIPANKGVVHTEETKSKISSSRMGKPSHTKPHTEQGKKNISESLMGKPSYVRTEEIKKKMSDSKIGIPKQKSKCIHCGKEVAMHVLNRWHMDNCRFKPKL